MVGTIHPCGGAWIIVHERNNSNFLSFRIDNDVIDPSPVLSTAGTNHTSWIGELVLSPQNDKIAALCKDGLLELFEFDEYTGSIRNPVTLYNENSPSSSYYSGVFSPNGQFLYVDEWALNPHVNRRTLLIAQYDLTHHETDSILNSRTIVGYLDKLSTRFPISFKLAPDDKIYFGSVIPEDKYIHRINKPDRKGIQCQFDPEYLSVGKGLASTNFTPDLVISEKSPTTSPLDTTLCPGEYLLIGRDTVRQAGTYMDTLQNNPMDCPTSQMIYLEYYDQASSDTLHKNITRGESFRWHDSLYATPGIYTHKTTDQHGCQSPEYLSISYSSDPSMQEEVEPVLPNAFTPNNDQRNDNFRVILQKEDSRMVSDFRIFNKWGQEVYQQTSLSPPELTQWDGRIDGREAPAGIYLYVLTLLDPENQSENIYNGSVHLLR